MAWAKDAGIQCLYLQSEDPLKKLTAATAHRKLVQLRHSPALGDDNHRRSTEGAAKGDWAVDRMTAPRRKLIVELRFVGLIDCPQRELSRVLCVFPCLSVDGITGMTRKKERVHPHTLPFPSPSTHPPLRRINRYPRVDGFSRDLGVEACSPLIHTQTTRCSSLLRSFGHSGLDGFWYNKTLYSPPRRQTFFFIPVSASTTITVQPHHLLTRRLFPLQALIITQLYTRTLTDKHHHRHHARSI